MLSHSTGFPTVDARNDFLRARRSARAARLLGRRRNVPRTLTDAVGLPRGRPRLEVIPTDAIVGTLEPTIVFDARFRPASDHVRARWERIALAHRSGVSLAPITVLERPDGYYVVDAATASRWPARSGTATSMHASPARARRRARRRDTRAARGRGRGRGGPESPLGMTAGRRTLRGACRSPIASNPTSRPP